MDRNEGIIQHGGSFQAGQLAVGRGARVRVVATGPDPELADRLEAFRRLLAEHATALDGPAEVRSTTEVLQQELAKPTPNRTTVRGLLAGLVEAVSSVAPLVTAAQALTTSIAAFL